MACCTAATAGLVDPLGLSSDLTNDGARLSMNTHAAEPVGAVEADVAGQLAGAEREADQGDVAQVELGQQPVEVGGEGVEVVADGRAGSTARTRAGRR